MSLVAGLLWLLPASLGAQMARVGDEAASLANRLKGDVSPTHDPVIIREGDTYHVFSTGLGDGPDRILAHRTSRDLVHWAKAEPPLSALPAWALAAVPGATNAWAPDISYVGGRYRLYYSVSTFGSNRSAIGLLTSPTLDPTRPDYGWHDEGLVVLSTPANDFNAIDPNLVVARGGKQWLALGSFWSGLKMFALNRNGKLRNEAEAPLSIARRLVPQGAPDPVEA